MMAEIVDESGGDCQSNDIETIVSRLTRQSLLASVTLAFSLLTNRLTVRRQLVAGVVIECQIRTFKLGKQKATQATSAPKHEITARTSALSPLVFLAADVMAAEDFSFLTISALFV
jgi:hypothetical protein